MVSFWNFIFDTPLGFKQTHLMWEDGRWSKETITHFFYCNSQCFCLREYVRSCKVDFCMSWATTLVHNPCNAGFEENAWTSATMIVGTRPSHATTWVFRLEHVRFFNARKFKGRMRIDVLTFEFLCSSLATFLQKRDTNMHYVVPVQIKMVVAIYRLPTGYSM